MQLVAGRTQQAPAVWLQHLPTCLSLLAQEWVHLLPTSVASPTRVALHLPSRTQSPLDSPGQEGIREGPTYSGWVLEAPTTIQRATAQPG